MIKKGKKDGFGQQVKRVSKKGMNKNHSIILNQEKKK